MRPPQVHHIDYSHLGSLWESGDPPTEASGTAPDPSPRPAARRSPGEGPPTPSSHRIREPLIRLERLPPALLHATGRVAELTAGLLVAGPEGDAVGRGDQL